MIVILMYTNLNVSRSETYLPRFVPNSCAGIHEEIFPLASETVRKSTYMVDSLDSTRENDTAIQLFHERQGLRGKAGMKARKRLSNSPEILPVIPQELRAFEIDLNHNALPSTYTLVVLCNAQEDAFSFRIATPVVADTATKRFIVGKSGRSF